jgi:dTDP-4-dehydrorhamnose reductase
MNTILVTGANGQLGNEMRLVSAASTDRYIFTDVVELPDVQTTILDITDLDAVRRIVRENGVNVIVNCAAYTNVDKAEDDVELCALLNAKAPENLAVAMKEAEGLLVHVSTDYVFGGDPYNTPCTEEQKGTPTGVYGQTKLDGENAIQTVGCNHVIIRTAWLYSEFGRNFVKTMLNLTAVKPQLNVVFDQTGTPTYALDLAEAIAAVIADYSASDSERYEKSGVYHYSNEGVCSWYDFTKMIAEYAGNTECEVLPCHSDEFPSKVKRPAYSVLDKTRIKKTFGVKVPYWTDSLRKCIKNLK